MNLVRKNVEWRASFNIKNSTLKISILLFSILGFNSRSFAQVDSSLFVRIPKDTTKPMLNMDAIYNRPFLNRRKNTCCSWWLPRSKLAVPDD